MSEKKRAKTLARIHKKQPDLQKRVEEVSALFLGTPYKLGPLGEGPEGEFDRDPLVDFEKVDCTTLVEQTMALALRSDMKEALETLQKIRYKEGKVSFETRNHFPEIDWIPQNVWAGYLRDVTREIAGDKVLEAGKNISKREWYRAMSTANVEGRFFTPDDRVKRLAKLQALGEKFPDARASLPVLPMDQLPKALERIPSGTIANLVREDVPDKPILVSHQVFIIKKNGQAFIRHAAFGKTVEDVPILEYFYRYYNSKWRLVGLNLNQLRDPKQLEARPR